MYVKRDMLVDTIFTVGEALTSWFLNLYFHLGIAKCNGHPRVGGYILKVFHTLTPSLHLCLGWYIEDLGMGWRLQVIFSFFYAMLAQLLEVEATLQ